LIRSVRKGEKIALPRRGVRNPKQAGSREKLSWSANLKNKKGDQESYWGKRQQRERKLAGIPKGFNYRGVHI